jgi:hypothetical protein
LQNIDAKLFEIDSHPFSPLLNPSNNFDSIPPPPFTDLRKDTNEEGDNL